MWARAYRDREYHAAVNTNNGTEAQNKVLKYSYLPKKKSLTLSGIATLIIENYLPDAHHKYLFQNLQQSSLYRSYNSFVPEYLWNRPRCVILHCLDRKGSSNKFTVDDVEEADGTKGIFLVHTSKETVHTVTFAEDPTSHLPSCTCQDWLKYHIPCKHFFAVFNHFPTWSWTALPQKYLNSAYLSTDKAALQTYHRESVAENIRTEQPNDEPEHTSECFATDLHEIPTRKVRHKHTICTM